MSNGIEDFQKWYTDNSYFWAFGNYFEGDTPPDISFESILHLDKNNLKPSTLAIVNFINSDESSRELKLGFWAYSQFQDIFSLTLNGERSFFNQHYCYYESLVYLRESIISWLDQNSLAAITLLRPFLELSIFHLYWYLRCEDKNYDNFYSWLEGKKGKTPFKDQIHFIFDNLPTKKLIPPKRINLIKTIILNSYKAVCSYNHTPTIDESIVGLNNGLNSNATLSFYFYLSNINIVVRQLTFLYTLAYPMSLFPVDRFVKWGFGGPLGIFFDKQNYLVVEQYLGSQNLAKIKEMISGLQNVQELLSWYDNSPDLTSDQIENSWNDFSKNKPEMNTDNQGKRIAIFNAEMHALGWFMNYFHESEKKDEISDEHVNKIKGVINNW